MKLLAGTDASNASFVPAVPHGVSMHRELELLTKAGLTPKEALRAATSCVAEAFGIHDLGAVAEGKRAGLLLIEGRPDKDITHKKTIKQIWIDGQPMF